MDKYGGYDPDKHGPTDQLGEKIRARQEKLFQRGNHPAKDKVDYFKSNGPAGCNDELDLSWCQNDGEVVVTWTTAPQIFAVIGGVIIIKSGTLEARRKCKCVGFDWPWKVDFSTSAAQTSPSIGLLLN